MTPAIGIPSRAWPAGLDVLTDEPMARHTYFGIGGPADFFVEVADTKLLQDLLHFCLEQGIPRFILGEGSNVLAGDDGVGGLVIHNACARIEATGAQGVSAESGTLMGQLARWCAGRGLAGMEFGVGIPGTVGGSVFGNAGCFGAEVKDVLESATVWFADGTRKLSASQLGFAYRHSGLQTMPGQPVVLDASFHCRPSSEIAIGKQMSQLARCRRATQPATRSAGSVFRNPPDNPAGRLIEQAGMKGIRRGRAVISEKHANFIVNEGGATAADVAGLIRLAREAVKQKFGIELELEIRLVGEGFGDGP